MSSRSSPLHPALVHMPVTFIFSASIADLITHTAQLYPTLVAPFSTIMSMPIEAIIQFTTVSSYFLTVAALITAIPAIISGVLQAGTIVKERGLQANSVKIMQLHAALMDISFLGVAYNWYTRRGAKDFRSNHINGILSVGILGLVVYAARLGKSLVFKYGFGVWNTREASKENVDLKKDQ